MKSDILNLLRKTNEYVSGQELCERFGVSRNAVWKAIESLKKDGYEIEAVRNRGYRLVACNKDIFIKREIEALLLGSELSHKVVFYSETGSTNSDAKLMAEEGEQDGLLVVADSQNSGRGRRGRSWVSPPGKNAYFSLMLKPDISPAKGPMVTLLMALSVALGVKGLMPKKESEELPDVGIKWPNDVVINGKKICGILTEMSMEDSFIHYIVIGVGINVKKQEFEGEISKIASSIDNEWDTNTYRSALVANIIRYFDGFYKEYLERGDLSGIKDSYEELLVNKGKEVRVLDPKGEYTAKALGIDENGQLMVERTDGKLEAIYAGEVSVRGVYGYI